MKIVTTGNGIWIRMCVKGSAMPAGPPQAYKDSITCHQGLTWVDKRTVQFFITYLNQNNAHSNSYIFSDELQCSGLILFIRNKCVKMHRTRVFRIGQNIETPWISYIMHNKTRYARRKSHFISNVCHISCYIWRMILLYIYVCVCVYI